MSKIELYNENCFDYLKTIPDKSVSLVLIDPPYEISKNTNFKTGKIKNNNTDRFRISMFFGEWDTVFDNLDIVINECYRILKNGGTIVCFYDIWKISFLKKYLENAKFKQIRFIEWIKTNPVPLNSKINYLSNAREIAVVGRKKGKGVFKSEYDKGIYEYPIYHNKKRFHPTQKPVTLLEELIKKHTNEGDLVLDCFAGSGSTTIAAYNTNRDFTGCELDKNYYEKTLCRLHSLGINLINKR